MAMYYFKLVKCVCFHYCGRKHIMPCRNNLLDHMNMKDIESIATSNLNPSLKPDFSLINTKQLTLIDINRANLSED